ncbi:DNA-formamidopyrimidine glycosylase [Candidatus Uhrbacteria bacterium CG_4_10_14_0_8_um_filter_58_22]|uniref:Formamidopyrimidine-DNA glycosylase n=1 Tax=Candidatus Uhrbacteria bacterium CG_4_10_14_0_8_um_filter_58_22 TaxID=1975029 RepID=A0A2M7QC38_9BACT|nr:MAG: DNA-formamidopyrimidine glycosylase [Parcubacteria group bacterium CG1_02_58_44]PIY63351.1 MAG: DNA-formamidopyrimidine glycosylase [Candidatus Uhrbacteria bacterium CG_4_10_14_0_8_um_filter_58_22]
MPELPEVETVRRQLERTIVGRRIGSVDVRFSGRLNVGAGEFVKRLVGRRILSSGRRAKLLLFGLSGGDTLVVHLKMTGKLLLVDSDQEPNRHTHVVFRLSGYNVLFFDDIRKFGYLHLFRTDDLERLVIGPAGYGPEPLGPGFRADSFAADLKRFGRSAIKPLLLSQKCVVGVGNIYSDETLWRSGIRPDRSAGTLEADEVRSLHDSIRKILRRSVRIGGTSVDSYRDAFGRRGGYERKLEVYGREGHPCSRCGELIRKVRLGGRGTHYCPKCQK